MLQVSRAGLTRTRRTGFGPHLLKSAVWLVTDKDTWPVLSRVGDRHWTLEEAVDHRIAHTTACLFSPRSQPLPSDKQPQTEALLLQIQLCRPQEPPSR